MSTLNVANISDDQSTLTGSNTNPDDKLHFNKTVDTKYVTNGCAKAWASFNQNPNPLSIYATFNVSTVEDTATGSATVNFVNSFNGVNQCQGIAANGVSANLATIGPNFMYTRVKNADGTNIDVTLVCSTAFGDLA